VHNPLDSSPAAGLEASLPQANNHYQAVWPALSIRHCYTKGMCCWCLLKPLRYKLHRAMPLALDRAVAVKRPRPVHAACWSKIHQLCKHNTLLTPQKWVNSSMSKSRGQFGGRASAVHACLPGQPMHHPSTYGQSYTPRPNWRPSNKTKDVYQPSSKQRSHPSKHPPQAHSAPKSNQQPWERPSAHT
jgi:hypothetical protein